MLQKKYLLCICWLCAFLFPLSFSMVYANCEQTKVTPNLPLCFTQPVDVLKSEVLMWKVQNLSSSQLTYAIYPISYGEAVPVARGEIMPRGYVSGARLGADLKNTSYQLMLCGEGAEAEIAVK